MNKLARLAVLTLGLTTAACHHDAPPAHPATTAAAQSAPVAATTFTGTLRGGIVAIGGDTTGWTISIDGGAEVDVEVSAVVDQATSLENKRVIIAGEMTTKKWVERGEQKVLIAQSITAAP